MALRIDVTGIVGSLVLIGLLAGCTAAGSGGDAPNGQVVQRSDKLPAPQIGPSGASAAQAEYRIGPLDLLEISVFQVADLSKTVKVSASGQIALPLIGTVEAGGKTVSELESEIAAKLGATYLQSPQVSVFVKEATSQRVTVDGAVEKPGIVPLAGPTTLLQTIAISGGLARGADPQGIVVFRTVENQRMAAKFDLAAIRDGSAEDPVLYGGDVVVVDRSAMRTALGDLRESIPIFAFFTPMI